MQDHSSNRFANGGSAPGPEVSPDNPCPFLRAVVSEGFVGGHVVPIPELCKTVEAASGKTGLQKKVVGLKTYPVALVANGFSPLRLLKSWWSGAELDALRNGPLDKHGVGSRILDASAEVHESEIARLAEFGSEWPDPCGGTERGLTGSQIKTYMNANFDRAKGHRRWFDRLLMNGEWPVLLDIMGKGEGDKRYLSVTEVRTLFVDRRLPDRINARLAAQASAPAPGPLRKILKAAVWLVALAVAAIVAIAEFPNQVGKLIPPLAQLLPPPLPDFAPVKSAHWLDQNWSTEDRHWFHHASQGTATFPVPYAWFVALEQPGLYLFTSPGRLADPHYLERMGFIPSPKTVRADAATLRRFGFVNTPGVKTEPAPETVAGLRPTPAENFDGLPVGFSRMTPVINPGTGEPDSDRIGLTCAACHTGSLRYKDVSVRFDGGAAMLELRKLESATGLAIFYTLMVPGRFDRFADRVLGSESSKDDRNKLKQGLKEVADFLKSQIEITAKTLKAKGQKDTDEGYGRLDALNRIGTQVFYTDLAASGLSDYADNIHANDAPVSYPPVWTVPWFWWAQYDASIEQPLIRNAGEALGVAALVNLSPDHPPEKLFSSSVALENLVRIEAMLRGPDPFGRNPKDFAGLYAPAWPSHLFPDDDAWKIKPERVAKGRALYAEICAECHLGPVKDPQFDRQFPDKSFWTDKRWKQDPKGGWVLDEIQKPVAHIGTDPAQANVLQTRQVQIPGFLDLQPSRDLGERWGCKNLATYSSTSMPFSIALMILVDKVAQKWIKDNNIQEPAISELWGDRSNCPNPAASPEKPIYRARPLNGVWATAPYIHNGSVPSLYWMLKPAAERPKQFCLGARDFDPKDVGFRVPAGGDKSCQTGETMFQESDSHGKAINGNSVMGHSLEADKGQDMKTYKNGVIGRALSDEERYDLIEYLKTL
ncbi:di-heme-cytochrome C peroxidase [Bradyrhizobium sp.]|uniref:di-heme-cytochrome C peroxidase n=1 Tax=Bradyrhizobium sp. TaxID=376 RepID=UPI00273570F3|nr:di-heme-cytochrome C peroxidase [Bradyrhizobium sp.]MDP3692959.1 di-heme-cytochrome C peroxidase [Bradyrhizobium sp.]